MDRAEAAVAVPYIKDKLDVLGVDVPIIGDFHYIGHKLLLEHPETAKALDKFRINPGNVGFRAKRGSQFEKIIEIALEYDKPVRIGVNWGSLDQELLTSLMDENASAPAPLETQQVLHEAIVQSALKNAELAEKMGMGRDKIILSAKVSKVQDLIAVYLMLAALQPRPASGLDRSGHGHQGHGGLNGGPCHLAATGHWRHHPRLADPGPRATAHHRSTDRPGNPAKPRSAPFHPASHRLPRLRAHHLDGFPRTGARH